MPEGPEIHRQARRLARLLQDRRAELFCAYPPLRSAIDSLQGQSIRQVMARGKAFLLEFDSGFNLYAHMQLYGRWQFHKSEREPVTGRQLRLRFQVGPDCASLYSATDLELLDSEALRQHPYLAGLGPDLLDSQRSPDDFLRALLAPRHQRRRLAGLLLDQSFWAGPGNYLRSEILYCAGLSPELRPCDLSPGQGIHLVEAALGLSWRSLETGGVTSHPLQVQEEKKARLPRKQYRHWAFGREGKPCRLCDGSIVREEWTGRRLYRCSRCPGGGGLCLDFSDLKNGPNCESRHG